MCGGGIEQRQEAVGLKVGIGYDVHRLIKGREITLGGIKIPFKKTFSAHSDGDVIIHAICDALLGACGLSDIGFHYPNTDEKYKGVSSLKLLEDTAKKISQKGYKINNVDCSLIANAPKISVYRDKMRASLSLALNISSKQINIKATTNEGIGRIGSQAIACYAAAMVTT